jgi:hypothetical protein
MFLASSCPSSGAYQLQQHPAVLPLERGGSSAVGRGRSGCEESELQFPTTGPTTTNTTATITLQR